MVTTLWKNVPVSVAGFTGERSVTVEGWIGVSVGVGVISFSGHHVTARVTSAVKTGVTKRKVSTRYEYEDA
jgi:hypothetical protein